MLTLTQDGTLTDSIAAVEAAWGKVAKDIGQDPAFVIAATHGKRAIDNLAQFKPDIKVHEMEAEVQAFEESILFFADAYNQHGPGSRQLSPFSSGITTPALSNGTSTGSGSSGSSSSDGYSGRNGRRPSSFVRRVSNRLALLSSEGACFEDVFMEEIDLDEGEKKDLLEAWQVEAAAVDRSVRILPGVKKLMDSIPEGRYAVATSGARTYGKPSFLTVGMRCVAHSLHPQLTAA